MVSIDDFKKLDLRIAKILNAEGIPGKDKLLKLEIDLGGEKKQIVAGIKQFYSREQLLGKSIIVVSNLDPSIRGGIESQAMLLAAKTADGKYCLVIVDGNVEPGTRVE